MAAWQIPLSAGDPPLPFGPDPAKIGQTNMLAAKLREMEQQQRQQQQTQNALKAIWADPSKLDPTGMPTGQALAGAVGMGADPLQILDIRNSQSQMQERQARTNALADKLRDERRNWAIETVGAPALAAYQDGLSKGMTPDQAKAAAQPVYTQGLDSVRKDGRLGPDEVGRLQPDFDPARVQANVLGVKEMMKRGQDFKVETDHGKSPPVQYRMYADGRMTDVAGTAPYTPTGIAEPKGAEAQLYKGDLVDDKGVKRTATLRVGPTGGFIDVDGGQPVTGAKNIRKMGIQGEDDPNAALPPDVLHSMAQQYLAGDKTVMQNIGRGVQGSKNIVALRGEIAKQMAESGMSGADVAAKMAEFSGMMAGMRTLGTRTANIEMAVNEAQQLAPLAIDASAKVNRTRFPLLNTVMLAAEKGTGDEDVVRFGIAVNSLVNVYARAINPTGVSRVSDIEHARELLATNWSKGQFNAGVEQLMREMEAARKSPGVVRSEMSGVISGRQGEPGKPGAAAPPTAAPSVPAGKNDQPAATAPIPPAPSAPSATSAPAAAPGGKAPPVMQDPNGVYLPGAPEDVARLPPGAKYRRPTDAPGEYRVRGASE